MRSFMREKKIFCGPDFLEVDIFPYTQAQVQAAKGKRSKKEKVSQPKQMNLNDKNARRYFVQLGNTNFGEGDYHGTFTYAPENLPQSPEEADRIFRNFLDRVRYATKKAGLPPVKYMLVTAYKTTKDSEKPTRIHHHIIMSGGLSRDEIEDLWRKRKKKGQKKGDAIGYANVDRLQPQGNGIAALCTYLTKQTGGKKRWTSSQGLDKPDPITQDPGQPAKQSRYSASANLVSPYSRTNDHGYSRKEVERIIKEHPDYAYWERKYPGYTLIRDDYGFKAEYNEETGRWAVYAKLRRMGS